MPHQPLRPAPPPPPPQRTNSKTDNNHFAQLQGITNDNNNNQQKGTAMSRQCHAAPVRPQKKVPPPRPAPPKRLPAGYREARSSASNASKKKSGHANGVRNGLGKYFNLRTGRAINERAPSIRHTKRRAPLPPRSNASQQVAVVSGASHMSLDTIDSLIDFNSPPPTPAQRALAGNDLSLLDLDFDDKGSIGDSGSLLDIDFSFQPDNRSLSSASSSSSGNQFSVFSSNSQPGHGGTSLDDLLSMGPSSFSAASPWTQFQQPTQTTSVHSSVQSSSLGKSSSFYIESSGNECFREFKKPTIIRPTSNDRKRGMSTSAAKNAQTKDVPHQQTTVSSSWGCSLQQTITINSSGESTSPSPSTERFDSPISETSDDTLSSYSPPEPQFPPPVLPATDSLDGMSDTSDGEQWCRAMFDFKGENADELTFSEGDYIRIEDFINLDWMMGSLQGKTGMVPLTFVELVQGPPPDGDEANSKSDTFKATAMYNFDSPVPGDLNFKEGDVIEVTKTINQDWWYGKLNGKEGQFPCNFVSRVSSIPKPSQAHSPHQLYRALYTFNGEMPGDLSFIEGDKIIVTELVNADWWRGKLVSDLSATEGIFPCAFVEPLS